MESYHFPAHMILVGIYLVKGGYGDEVLWEKQKNMKDMWNI